MSDPPISVVMTAYNGREYVGAAIESVLAQTWEDFELVIVDDGSTDDTLEVIRGYTDRRIRVLPNERNLGIGHSRNKGMDAARGRYIAAHDQDDMSLPNRLACHMGVFESQPDVVLAAGRERHVPPQADEILTVAQGQALAWQMFTYSPLAHSAVSLRKDAFGPGVPFYNQQYRYADDLDLYHRLGEVGRLVFSPEYVCIYRHHETNTSITKNTEMNDSAQRFFLARYREYLGPTAVELPDIASVLKLTMYGRPARDLDELDRVGTILDDLVDAFLARRHVEGSERDAVYAEAARVWWRAVRVSGNWLGRRALERYRAFDNLSRGSVSLADRAEALAMSVILPIARGARAP